MIDLQPQLDDSFLHFARQLVPELLGRELRVDEQRAARRRHLEHVVALEEVPLVHGDEARAPDEVATGSAAGRSAGAKW